ncbi:unnamed protein product [Urochloa humidicola]
MVRRGGDEARVKALLAADATECWHLLRWWHPCSLGALPPTLRSKDNVPRSLRWASCGAISTSSTSALLVRLFSPECEPQNIAAYDKPEHKQD